ncbi:alternate-type signal peptide domain-containing protein [Mycetocola spongiae]|uniref:alternate-type signal peptide domain-containing protein n=1 Tax=Mycetocola spongiae TaxID=2859226 RepID=UPI001CF0E619|nr:alternate-type signal peptide domain-containing protein [Mycetocola spongiae]UCR89628.1 alternate-type signal peptide domain-containing protein [Mycetocola spongiae]
MKNSTRGIIVGALGLGLLAGGSSFALWSNSAEVSGGTITAGNLEITAAPTVAWADASPEHNAPVAIDDPADFLTTPGDVITRTQDVAVTLTGDNIAGILDVSATGLTGALAAASSGVSATYSVSSADGNTPYATGVALGTPTEFDVTPGNLTVTITLAFDGETADRVRTNAQAALGDITFTLTQDR